MGLTDFAALAWAGSIFMGEWFTQVLTYFSLNETFFFQISGQHRKTWIHTFLKTINTKMYLNCLNKNLNLASRLIMLNPHTFILLARIKKKYILFILSIFILMHWTPACAWLYLYTLWCSHGKRLKLFCISFIFIC